MGEPGGRGVTAGEKSAIMEAEGGVPLEIGHVAMYVNDLEAAREFFEKYFGAVSGSCYHNRQTDFCSYFLSFGSGACLELMNRPGMSDMEKSAVRTGYIHMAFRTGSREAVDDLTKRLRDDGYEVAGGPRVTGDGYYESCVVGIEENLIEITE